MVNTIFYSSAIEIRRSNSKTKFPRVLLRIPPMEVVLRRFTQQWRFSPGEGIVKMMLDFVESYVVRCHTWPKLEVILNALVLFYQNCSKMLLSSNENGLYNPQKLKMCSYCAILNDRMQLLRKIHMKTLFQTHRNSILQLPLQSKTLSCV